MRVASLDADQQRHFSIVERSVTVACGRSSGGYYIQESAIASNNISCLGSRTRERSSRTTVPSHGSIGSAGTLTSDPARPASSIRHPTPPIAAQGGSIARVGARLEGGGWGVDLLTLGLPFALAKCGRWVAADGLSVLRSFPPARTAAAAWRPAHARARSGAIATSPAPRRSLAAGRSTSAEPTMHRAAFIAAALLLAAPAAWANPACTTPGWGGSRGPPPRRRPRGPVDLGFYMFDASAARLPRLSPGRRGQTRRQP
jgi:hypothetical protein